MCGRRRRERERGFTLIELLVVISIVVLLMGLLLPALSRARKQARDVVCRAHLRQWGTVLTLYLEENEGRFSREHEGHPGLAVLRGLRLDSQTDPNAHQRYHAVRTERIACCPMATRTTVVGAYTYKYSGEDYLKINRGGTFAAWEIIMPTPSFRGSYALNRNVFSFVFEGPAGNSVAMNRSYTDVTSTRGRGNIPLLLDGGNPRAPC